PPQVHDHRRIEPRSLEDQHDVGRVAAQAGGEPVAEAAPEDRIPAPRPLLARAQLAAERCEGRREGETAPVIATIERGDEHHPQSRERRGWRRRHTSTLLRYSNSRIRVRRSI